MRRPNRALAAALAAVGTLAGSIIAATPVEAAPNISTVIPGLNAPRGVTFDGLGNMYVAEAGVAGAGDIGLTHSGRVSRYPAGSSVAAWQTAFESAFITEQGPPPDVLGPSGISAVGNGCMKNSPGQRMGCQVAMIMAESHDGIAADSGGTINTQQMGHLFRLDGASGAASSRSDFGDQMYAWTGERKDLFPSDFPDSNPYGVLVTKSVGGGIRTFVADAGANTISEVMPDGTARVIAYIPNETAPPFRDATPTCIAQGPDGMLYVATLHLLDLFALGHTGGADVWRVNPNANYPTAPTLWATGLTTATACTFDRAGNFWATEMFAPTAGPPGDLVRIPFAHPDQLTHVGAGMLPLPGGIAQGPDGAMYVTINSSSPVPGSGAVVRVSG